MNDLPYLKTILGARINFTRAQTPYLWVLIIQRKRLWKNYQKMFRNSKNNFYSSLYIINFRVKKRDEYHRRRMFDPDAPIDFINERNRKFNHKLERYYGKYTEDIKEDLERGTAIWALLKDFTPNILNFQTFLSISFFRHQSIRYLYRDFYSEN